MDFLSFTLIVDDIVFPDGRTSMGNLGGGGPQTLFGYQVATDCKLDVGLVAGVGEDLPEPCKEWLRQNKIDLGGLLQRKSATPRAWQILEDDGRRAEVWRTEFGPQLVSMLRPQFEDLPARYQQPRSVHLAVHPLDVPQELLHRLRQATSSRGGHLSVETFTQSPRRPSPQELRALVSAGHIFTPNHREAASLVGAAPALEMAERLVEAGAEIAVVRCGEDGSVVKDGRTGEAWQVPAVTDIQVVDVTGCGNTFCGGFSGALDLGLGLRDALLWGAVAASFMAEVQGVPRATAMDLRPEALRRLEALQPHACQVAPATSSSRHTAAPTLASSKPHRRSSPTSAAALSTQRPSAGPVAPSHRHQRPWSLCCAAPGVSMRALAVQRQAGVRVAAACSRRLGGASSLAASSRPLRLR